jgi:hypothetical protein
MIAVVGFFWHDEIKIFIENWQNKAEEQAPSLINQGIKQAKNWWESQGKGWADNFVANLTSQGKQKIDAWLSEQGLNQYGDAQGTAYAGGTPLFDEKTGQSTNRYTYLLKKFPDLVESLNLEQYLK